MLNEAEGIGAILRAGAPASLYATGRSQSRDFANLPILPASIQPHTYLNGKS